MSEFVGKLVVASALSIYVYVQRGTIVEEVYEKKSTRITYVDELNLQAQTLIIGTNLHPT
jgi:hypothetical protein